MRIGTRLAVVTLFGLFSAWSALPAMAQVALPGGDVVEGLRAIDVPEPARVAEGTKSILEVDRARFEAWQKGDFQTFGAVVAEDLVAVDGMGAPGKQQLNHDQFLAYAKAARPASTATLEETARVFGFEYDMAIVRGIIKDETGAKGPGAGSGSGEIYDAVYVKQLDDWELVRFIISPLEVGAAPRATPPGPAWSINAFSPSQQARIVVMRDSFEEVAAHDLDGMQKTLESSYVDIDGDGVRDFGKDSYIRAHTPVPKETPGLIGLDKPTFQAFGQYGEVIVISGIRRDATAGVIYGSKYAPPWRNVVYYMAVMRRMGHHLDDWRMVLYHATYVHPKG